MLVTSVPCLSVIDACHRYLEMTVSKDKREFVVVMRSSAVARFSKDAPPMILRDFPTPAGAVQLTYRTIHRDDGLGVLLPRELWIEARGPAPSLDDAITAYRNAANSLGVIIALSANAVIQPAIVHIAFDNSSGKSEREYYVASIEEERGIPCPGRLVDVSATFGLLQAVFNHHDSPRFHRAIAQYAHAISFWSPGLELLAVAYLFMSVDALTKLVLEDQLGVHGLSSNNQLAAYLGVDIRQLDAEVRRRFILENDVILANEFSDISNAFEHGYGAVPDLIQRSVLIRDRVAHLVRSALIRSAKLDGDIESELLARRWAEPKSISPYTVVLRGKLIGESQELADPDSEYPLVVWKPRISNAVESEPRRVTMKLEGEITVTSLASGVSFLPTDVEIYGPGNARDLNHVDAKDVADDSNDIM